MARPLGDKWELALITYRSETDISGTSGEQDMVEFVNFSKMNDAGLKMQPSLAKAQLVRTDAMDRIVFSTTAFRPWTNFAERQATVVIPACGVQMKKRKNSSESSYASAGLADEVIVAAIHQCRTWSQLSLVPELRASSSAVRRLPAFLP